MHKGAKGGSVQMCVDLSYEVLLNMNHFHQQVLGFSESLQGGVDPDLIRPLSLFR